MAHVLADDLRESRARCELAERDRCSCLLCVVVITELTELSSPARCWLTVHELDTIYLQRVHRSRAANPYALHGNNGRQIWNKQ